MADHLIIDASRQPSQIRCTRCGAAQDLQLPMPITSLVRLEQEWRRKHLKCGNGVGTVPADLW
jgi:hypothetical protein